MKKLVLMLAVMFSVSLVSCNNKADNAAETAEAPVVEETVVEEAAVVVDSAAAEADSTVAAAAEEAPAAVAE